MEIQPAFGFKEVFSYVIGEVAKALCERDGETGQRQTRSEAAARMTLAFTPRDVIEAMLAGHCVMLHELMVDGVREVFHTVVGPARRSTRSAVLAMDKAFGRNLADLERYQKREADGRRDGSGAPVEDAPNETDIADRVRRHQEQASARAEAAAKRDVPDQAKAPVTGTAKIFHPSSSAVAAVVANPEAMAALEAADPARFARAVGIDKPSTAYIAAASGPMRDRNGLGARGVVTGAVPIVPVRHRAVTDSGAR